MQDIDIISERTLAKRIINAVHEVMTILKAYKQITEHGYEIITARYRIVIRPARTSGVIVEFIPI